MALGDEELSKVDRALAPWRQGDVCLDATIEFVHMSDLRLPLTDPSIQTSVGIAPGDRQISIVAEEVHGFMIVTQSCDVIRECINRPYIEVAPLVKVTANQMSDVKAARNSVMAYVPGTEGQMLVADLDRIMTVEKSIVAGWARTVGCANDEERRRLGLVISRRYSRFAFPDDFVEAAGKLRTRILEKGRRASPEGEHIQALEEIRVRAAPSWVSDEVQLTWYFIKKSGAAPQSANWPVQLESWIKLFDTSGRFRIESYLGVTLGDITAQEYLESDKIEFDRLSV